MWTNLDSLGILFDGASVKIVAMVLLSFSSSNLYWTPWKQINFMYITKKMHSPHERNLD